MHNSCLHPSPLKQQLKPQCLLPSHLHRHFPTFLHPHLPHLLALPHSPLSSLQEDKPKGTWAKLKQMVRDYWYVIVPVEVVTSVMWYASIYLSLQSGLDMVAVLEALGASEATVARLPSAEAGYHAIAFILYKVLSPVRHGVSLAISSVVVARLERTRPGYLRTSGELAKEGRERGREGMENAKERYDDAKEKFDDKKEIFKDKMESEKKEMKERLERLEKLYQQRKRK